MTRSLSPTQHGIWLAEQVNPGQPVYNVPAALRLRGELSPDGLRHAVEALVRRHRALRTRFVSAAGLPRRTVLDHADVPVRVLRLPDEAAARQAMDEEIARPFAVATDPLLRVSVIRYAEDECFLLLVSHHLVSDGWSVDVLLEELAAHYRADGDPVSVDAPSEPELPPLDAATAEENLAFWERTLRDAPAATEPLGSGRRPSGRTNRGMTSRFTLPDELCATIREFGRTRRVSPAVTLLAGFAALLTRCSGQQDLVIGTSLSGRDDPATERLVDCLVKVVPLRITAGAGTDFAGLLGTTRDAFIDALEHQDVVLEDLARRLGTDRDGSPLFRVLFGYSRGHAAPRMAGLETAHVPVNTATAKFDLTWNVNDDGERIEVEVEHRPELIDAAQAARLAGHWCRLLGALLAEPEALVARAELLSAEERARLVGAAPAPRVGPSAAERFAGRVAAAGDSVAVSDGTLTLTYRQLNDRAANFAALLAAEGVTRGDRIGLCLTRTVDMAAAVLAVWRLGAAYVPVDPDNPASRIEYVLGDARVPLVLTDAADRVPAGPWRTLDTSQATDAVHTGPVRPDPTELAYVIYTSGSTGRPKGVEVTHGNLATLLAAGEDTVGLRDTDVWPLFHSFAFDFSVWEIWGALAYGGRLVVVPREVTRDPAAFRDLLVRERVTVLNQTPSAFRQFVAEDERHPAGELGLRLVVFGGEALDLASVRAWWRRHASDLPVLVNMYGITETTVHVTWQVLDEERIETSSSPIGRALPGYRALVLDEYGEPVPVGVQGELYVGGDAVARGYLGRPALTAERFVPDPFTDAPGARLYRSGDLARWTTDGDLEYLGRNDDQVKIRGFRIELGEVAAAVGRHPAVRGVTVVVREDRLVAYAACPDGTDPHDLRDLAAAHFPSHMVPAAVVTLDALPLTRNGKIDHAALPAPEFSGDTAGYVAPRTPAEEILAEIWAEILQVDKVGADDGFFDLGGDSIRAVQVAALARGRGLGLAVAQIYEHRTLAGLAAAADTAGDRAGTKPFELLSPADRARIGDGPAAGLDDAYPMTALQVGMVYHMASDPRVLPYVNAASYRLPYRFDEDAFDRAVRSVVARHPVLRTGFDLATFAEPMQLVHREAELPVAVEDLRALTPAEQERAVDELMERERRRPFDVERPPMLRLAAQVLTDDSFQWTMVEHHAILDGWSLWSTITEILLQYTRLLDGAGLAELPAPASAYRDFVALEQRASASPEARRFWTETLAGSTPPQLPARAGEAPAPAGPSLRSDGASGVVDGYGWRDAHVPAGLAPRVTALAKRLGVPEKTVLLTAHLQVIAAQTGLDDVCCGLTLNGRLEENGGTEARGLFLNTVPFRVGTAGGSRAGLVRRVFDAEARILPHRRMPLARIRQFTGGRDLFTTNFTFNNFHVMRDTMGDGEHAELLSGLGELTAIRRVEPADVPLTVTFFRNPLTDGLQLCIDYDANRLAPEQIEEIAEQHVRALELLVDDPEGELTGPAATAVPAAVPLSAPTAPAGALERFAAQVAARGDHIAVADGTGAGLTYRQLNERASTFAALLAGAGVNRGDRIGLCLTRTVDMAAAVLAVWRLGAAYVPVDADYPAARLEFVLGNARVPLVLTDPDTAGRIPAGTWRTLVTTQATDAVHTGSVRPGPAELAYVIYTSGSTGTPKGVEVTHGNLATLLAAGEETVGLSDSDVWSLFHSFAFDVSVWEMWGALAFGGRLVVVPREVTRDPAAFLDLLVRERVTVLSQTPSAFRQLVTAEEQHPRDELALRLVVFAGEALDLASVRAWWRRHAPDRPVLVNMYGITETTVHVTWQVLDEERIETSSSPIGRALPGYRTLVLDADGNPAPVGMQGELYVGGDAVARGYLGRPALTAERFVPDPFTNAPGARLYRSGDLARWTTDGDLEYLGRNDDQVKIRGFRIELGEVAAAVGRHPAVRGVAVVVREDTPGDRRLVAYTACPDGTDPRELRDFATVHLPAYMAPSAFVVLETLPLTPNGKIDRAALPAPEFSGDAAGYVAPRTPVEEGLARVWAEILKVDRVGMEDDFFDLGGDSIRAVQIAFRVQRGLGIALRPVDVQLHPTVAELARHLSA
ncbi:amino acid adenylation domain-containing protein [Kitasatospora sp. NPDC059408]|uniref:amino acid adenylation domain-containing protein n=1 Tax=Kitasatospora sp. NPDC059408 TaxID=3346823 RepID=UPI003674D582